MGSGAFLVEACRQLGDVLVKAWHLHDQVPRIPPDEDEVLHARRLIAQRCLYGVDKNAMAVDLAKLSLWLATLAKDHPFTFLDHALRHGDSLVGLTRKQITEFHWVPTPQRSFGQDIIEQRIKAATGVRQEIIEAGDDVPFLLKQQKLALADERLNLVRFAGNLVIAAFFAGDNDKQRKLKREELLQQFSEYLRTGNMALRPKRRSTTCAPATRRFIRFIGRSNSPKFSDAKTAGSMRLSEIRRLPERTRWQLETVEVISIGSNRCTRNPTVTRIKLRIFFAGRSRSFDLPDVWG